MLPLIPKVIEKVIYAQASTFPNSKNLLYTYLCPNYLNEVFDVAIENNFQLRGSFQKLKCPFRKTNTGQLALSYIGPTFWNKTPDTIKRTKNLNTFKHNLKKYFLNELKNCNNFFLICFGFQLLKISFFIYRF